MYMEITYNLFYICTCKYKVNIFLYLHILFYANVALSTSHINDFHECRIKNDVFIKKCKQIMFNPLRSN